MPCLLQVGGTCASTLTVCRMLLLQLYLFRGKRSSLVPWFGVIRYKYSHLSLCLKPPGGCCFVWQELRPKSLDIKQEELGDMVEKEMASTSEAIEDAVRRIEVRRSCRTGHFGASGRQFPFLLHHHSNVVSNALSCVCQQEMMSQARNESSGVKLEVNER